MPAVESGNLRTCASLVAPCSLACPGHADVTRHERGRLAVVPLRVGVLGPVTVWRDGREQAAGQPRQLAVLGVLATRANRVVSRGELIDAVWGDQPPASAEGGIYTYVAGLRRVIEPDRPRRDPDRSRRAPARTIVSGGGGYLLRLGAGALDADHFERCLAAAARAAGGRATWAARCGRWTRRWRSGAACPTPGCPARSPRPSSGGSPSCAPPRSRSGPSCCSPRGRPPRRCPS